ncbi:MAG: fatty acid desaturase [Acidobacteriota bacterium]|nr:fatty acid desaturase [Acidobacteriota bacterium]
MNIAFLTLTPIIGVVGTAAYTWYRGFHLWQLVLMVTMYLAVGMSICAGYHRFFSHKSYEAHPIVQAFFAFFGAMAAENSILEWSSQHRVHHKHADKDWDPYNIQRGFWWAHIFWIFYKNEGMDRTYANAPDLKANPIVMWQHRWNKVVLIAGGFGIPTLIGAAFGDPIGGLLWGGFTRLVVIHHTTFFVNSLAHYFGKPEFNSEASARDNWLVALVTLGEGYHSFHHRFPADFRNGIRWYQWDPAKWFIAALRGLGLADHLLTTPLPQIEQARMSAALRDVEPKMATATGTMGEEVRRRLQIASKHLEKAVRLWRKAIEQQKQGSSWRITRKLSRRHVRRSRREWQVAVRMLRAA